MAKFIEGYSAAQLPPPYGFEGVRIWSFPLVADLAAVQGIVDRCLGPVQQGDETFSLIRGFTPAQSGLTIVYMMVLDYARMRCLEANGGPNGYLSQRGFLFGIVVKRRRTGPPSLAGFIEDLAFFTPVIYVDNPWSAICGNTVLGYPKLLAWFQLPQSGFYPLQMETQVFVDDDPNTGQTWQLLADIRSALPQNPLTSALSGMFFGDLDALYGPNGVFPLDSDTLGLFQNRHRDLSYDIIQLKQFRSAEVPAEACYRALLTCRVEITKMRGFGLLPPAIASLPAYASVNLPAELGLRATPDGRYLPLSPYWVDCDFKLVRSEERPAPDGVRNT